MACREIIDCESLIMEVQKRPALYDFKLKEYSDKQVKEKLWTEVCEALFSNWIYLSPEDKKGKVLLLQRRWKSLRECFRRELKAQNGKSGDGALYRKKYMYFNQLLFLTNKVDERPTCSNYLLPQCDQAEVLDEETTEVTPIKLETIVRPQKQRKIREDTKKSYEEEEPIDVLRNKAQEDIDEDKSFLMSLLPKFKKFSDDQKFEAQIEILKIMRQIHQKSTRIPSNEYYGTMPSIHTFPLQTAPAYISHHSQGYLPHQGQISVQHQLFKGRTFTTMASIAEESSNKMFGGWQKVFSHDSKELGCKMKFGVYIPPQAESEKVPVIYWLSGLTCTEQNFVTKAGAQQFAAKHGFLVVAPDTSPRGCNIEGEEDSWDFGTGAGFYVDATEEKWKKNYRMYSYVTKELPELVAAHFKVQSDKSAIMGHSMGGHGALICALKNPGQYRSVSAFAPICNPINCPWGVKAFTGYLGDSNKDAWKDYDACELLKKYNGPPLEILVDQGKADNFLTQGQLLPDNLVSSCAAGGVPVVMRMQEDYDHSYYFIASFMADHFDHHAKFLKN